MDRKIRNILSHKILILLLSILLLGFGIYSYINIPKQEMPDIDALYGFVQVTSPGLNPEEIDEHVAKPIHDIINEYSNVKGYQTTLLDNVCIIIIEMNIGDTTSEETLEEIKTRTLYMDRHESITDIRFITEVKDSQAIYAVHSSTLSEYELQKIAEDLALQINSVTNVTKTNVDSAYSQQVLVEIDYETLNNLPITIADVYGIVLANAAEIPLGNTEFNGVSSSIIINSYYENIEDIEDIILFADEYGTYYLKDVADISLVDTESKKTYEFNTQPAAFVEVYFLEDIDFTVIGDELKEKVESYAQTLDEDVIITPMTFSPHYVKEQVNQVMINLAQCIVIVMLVVLIGLGFRNSLAIAITIPVIVMTTLGILYALGQELELISIAGLIVSIGILVDNSIVISESAQHNLDAGMKKEEAANKAVRENAIPVLSSTLTTVAAFVPLLALPGIAGDVAYSLPLTVLTAISLSFIVAMTLTPTLAKMFFKPKRKRKKHTSQKHPGLEKTLNFIFKLKALPVVLSIAILGILGYLVVENLTIDVLPKTEASVVYIDYSSENNSNEEAYNFAKEIEEIVLLQPDVINHAFSQGGDLPKFYLTLGSVSTLPKNGRFFIGYDCETQDLVNYMKMLETDLQPLTEHGEISVNRLELAQPTAPVQIFLTGQDYTRLINVSESIFAEVVQLDAYKDGQLVAPDKKTDIILELDKTAITQNGLTIIEVQQQISTHVNGIKQPLYQVDENLLDVKIATDIKNHGDLLNLKIKSPSGVSIKLSDIAKITETEKLEYINLYDGIPSVTIEAYMQDGYSTYDLEGDITEIISKYNDGSMNVVQRGDNELTNEIMGSMLVAFVVALIAIYLIMYFQFKSFIQPLIILMSIPLSFIGSLAALLIMNEDITLTGLLGLVSLIGIVVNNGILLVEYINRSVKEGHSVKESCILSVSRRLRPILLASLTTILGIIPLAVFGGDFFRPLAVTFMGGMFTSTLLVLFIIPSLYYLTHVKKEKLQK